MVTIGGSKNVENRVLLALNGENSLKEKETTGRNTIREKEVTNDGELRPKVNT